MRVRMVMIGAMAAALISAGGVGLISLAPASAGDLTAGQHAAGGGTAGGRAAGRPAVRFSTARSGHNSVAYLANYAGDVVTTVNMVTRRAGPPIKVGIHPVAIAISPDGQTAYVACSGSNTVVPIDTATGKAGSPISVGVRPSFIAITPDGRTAYVADNGSSQVTPIDLADRVAGPPISVGRFPRTIAITPDGATAYVVSNGVVTPIKTSTDTALSPITVGRDSRGVAMTPNGKTVYVLNTYADSITPILVSDNVALPAIHVGGFPHQMVIEPNGHFGYVTLSRTSRKGYLAPIRLSTNTARPAIRVGHRPTAIAITPDGKTVYVVNRHDSVTPIRTATNLPQKFIQVGVDPDAIAITPNGQFAYVASGAPGNGASVPGRVTFIDTATDTITKTVGIATDPVAIGLAAPTSPVTIGTAVPAPWCSNKIVTAPKLSAVTTRLLKVPGPPFGVAITPNGQWQLAGLGKYVGVVRTGTGGWHVKHLIQLPAGDSARGVGLTPDGKYLLVANLKQGADVIDVAKAIKGQPGALLGTLDAPSPAKGAFEVAFSGDGKYAFVTLAGEKEVAVFNLGLALTNGFGPADYVGAVPVGVTTVGIASSPHHRWLYATSEVSVPGGTHGMLSTISVAKAETDPAQAVVSNVNAGCRPVRVIADPDGKTVWVTARQSNALVAFSASKLVTDPWHALIRWIRVGVQPIGLAAANCGSQIVVADSHRFKAKHGVPNLAVVSVPAVLAGKPAVLGNLRSGLVPREMTVAADGKTLLVGNYGSGQLETVNLTQLPGAAACPTG